MEQHGTAPAATASEPQPAAGGHVKLLHSPTLLFDLLVEPDKGKQAEKLRVAAARAGTSPPGLADKLSTHSRTHPSAATDRKTDLIQADAQLQPETPRVVAHPVLTGSANEGKLSGLSARAQAPTPHGTNGNVPQNPPASPEGPNGHAAVNGHAADAFDSRAAAANNDASVPTAANGNHPPLSSELLVHQAGAHAVSIVSAKPAHLADGNAAVGSSNAGAAAAAAAATADANAIGVDSDIGEGADALDDMLSAFTPRVILEELLGDLFVAPERLVVKGTFGAGAFATVESCVLEDPGGGLSRLVAVKALKPEVLADAEDLKRFLLEANLLRKMRHKNIVSTVGIGARDLDSMEGLRRSAYMVMEALEGGDLKMMVLRQMTARTRAYNRRDALRWCLDIASACAYLHGVCRPMVIHRDLKLENVMLTGGSVDARAAKITDFGLHKRARYDNSHEVLIAVTNEWSVHAGSVYRSNRFYGGSNHAPAGPSVRGGSAHHNGMNGVSDASYYGGGVYPGMLAAVAYGGSVRGGSMHRGTAGGVPAGAAMDRSVSAHYAKLAAAGLAAVGASGQQPQQGVQASPHVLLAAAATAALNGSNHSHSQHHQPDHNNSQHGPSSGNTVQGAGLRRGYGSSSYLPGALSLGRGSAAPPPAGDSLRAGSEAASALGMERPYLLAYDNYRHVDSSVISHSSSAIDLVALGSAGVGAHPQQQHVGLHASQAAVQRDGTNHSRNSASGRFGATNISTTTPFGAPDTQAVLEAQGSGTGADMSLPPRTSMLAAAGHLLHHEESVHRKMLALMALEKATSTLHGAGASGGGAPSGGAAAEAEQGQQGFSVTEYVRAASMHIQQQLQQPGTGAVAECPGPTEPAELEAAATGPHDGPVLSPLQVLRSMTLALQQQQAQGNAAGAGASAPSPTPAVAESGSPVLSAVPGGLTAASAGSGLPPRPSRPAGFMKSVPEHTRMSIELKAGTDPAWKAPPEASAGTSSIAAAKLAAAAAAGSMSGEGRTSKGRRQRVAAATARMADATRQVGSLLYMAPELVTSNAYNEKVDVFSFGIMAYELFMGKLLAIKVANDFTAQLPESQRNFNGTPGASTGLPEDEAEAGIMSYVMRRSCAGAREAMPSWWPKELCELVGRCWAHDPADRPTFDEIVESLARMQRSGLAEDMDARDPLLQQGCGCAVM